MYKFAIAVPLMFAIALNCPAQDDANDDPPELKILNSFVGVWDAEIEFWPQGPDSPSIKFSGVETVRAYGKHWLASDFDSEFMGQTMSVHSIVGYDLDKKKLVGTVIDQGPYAATMEGKYNEENESVDWVTKVKAPDGTKMEQKTRMTRVDDNNRSLVLIVPDGEGGVTNSMQIKFVKRK